MKRKRIINYYWAFSTMFHQGLEAAIIPFIYIATSMFILKNSYSVGFSISMLSIKEFFGLILIFLTTGWKVFVKTIKRLRTPEGKFFILASIGTATGNMAYLIAVVLAGTGYGVILTSLYPIIAILFNKFFIANTKEKYQMWLGVIISLLSGFSFILFPSLFGNNSYTITTSHIVGMIMGLLSAMAWAFESVCIKIGLSKNNKIQSSEIIIIRCLLTFFCTFIVMLPLSQLFYIGNANVYSDILGDIITNWIGMIVIFATAVNVIILRFCHVTSIEKNGVKITSIVDSNNFIISPIFALIFINVKSLTPIYEHEVIQNWNFFLLIPLIIGILLTLYYHKTESSTTLLKVNKVQEHS